MRQPSVAAAPAQFGPPPADTAPIAPSARPEPAPSEARRHLRAALVALGREQLEPAKASLLVALELDPSDADVRAFLGAVFLAEGHPSEAQQAIDEAVRLGPDRFAPRLKAGELAMRLGVLESAETHFLAALRAATPGSRDAIAARDLLGACRRRLRRSIGHEASLPSGLTTALARLFRSRRRPVARRVGTAGGRTARPDAAPEGPAQA